MLPALVALAAAFQREIMLFAAVGLAVGGVDDLLLDIIYLVRRCWRRATVYSRHQPMTTATLPLSPNPEKLAVFIAAWHESGVIGHMLRAALAKWGQGNYRIFVGAYPNDAPTIAAAADAAHGDPHVVIVINDRSGPTTKADCLNVAWRAMLRDEAENNHKFKAVVLHDAEDVVHADELRLLDIMIDRFDLVQLPVLPLHSQQSRWVAGHYCDEFAESHAKCLVVREALGAAVPSAGVGCAFSRAALATLAAQQGGQPFNPDSLTEDYEMGLRIVENGGSSVFVQMRDAAGRPVCTREHFPETIDAAVRQKARWTVGIALSGWDRLGWKGGFAERWMRLRDRRAALSAIIVFAAYLATLLYGAVALAQLVFALPSPPLHPLLVYLLWFNGGLMSWRAAVRMAFVGRAYGWRQALISVPRAVVANVIAILAARRAVGIYFRLLRGAPLVWEKTVHRFPGDEAESAA